MNPAIIVVTYNRPNSLKRLLTSLLQGNYPDGSIPLVISIDFEDSAAHTEVLAIANSCEWKFGEKKIISHHVNLGLRKHVLSCGQMTHLYEAVIVLEDDVIVSPAFYNYTNQILRRYSSCDHIAGVSLYKHLWNVNAVRPFSPQEDGNDVFFMQFAQSWGQCWTRGMWDGFYGWYKKNDQVDLSIYPNIPGFVRSWSDKSWLKFFICYIIQNKKYFVYPYSSLSTNCGDAGTHVEVSNTRSNVPLALYDKEYLRLPEISEGVRYDAFFEREGLQLALEYGESNLCVDLYGHKKNFDKRRYWLTSIAAPYHLVRSYSLNFRPIELNVILQSPGSDIFLYDTHQSSSSPKRNEVNEILYDVRHISLSSLLKLLVYKVKSKFGYQ